LLMIAGGLAPAGAVAFDAAADPCATASAAAAGYSGYAGEGRAGRGEGVRVGGF